MIRFNLSTEKGVAMAIIAQALWILAYLIVGSILSVPYTYLAGGSSEHFILATMAAPVASFALVLAYAIRKVSGRTGERPWGGGGCFLVIAAYLFLPAILNGASHLLGWVGFEAASGFVFEIRYIALLVVPAFIVVLLIGRGIAEVVAHALRRRFKRTAVPPADTPSGNGFSPSDAATVPS